MSGPLSDDYIPLDTMKRESGEKTYPIWLLFNPKHPVARLDIWIPVLAEIQDMVFRKIHARIDTSNIYIRNAVSENTMVPNTLNWWGPEVYSEIELLRDLLDEYNPKILISFGAFPYEFVRRVYMIKPEKGPKFWGTSNLEEEFDRAIENFDINKTNRIPLLRQLIEGGKFIEDGDFSYRQGVENYYYQVGTRLAEKLLENKNSLNIWIE